MDSMDVKDLQYRIVKSRQKAVKLISDIYNAEAKAMIKNIKEIESEPIKADLSYKPLNIEKIQSAQIPILIQEDKTLEQIAEIRSVLKVIKRQ